MKIMAVETAGDALHLALQTEREYFSTTSTLDRRFSEELVLRMQNLCTEGGIKLADLSLIVCANGPGSFTGLRIGMAAAKGVSLAANIPLVSLSTLEIYQYPLAFSDIPVVCALDAKKNRFYCALFIRGERQSADMDVTVARMCDLIASYPRVIVTGRDAGNLASQAAKELERRNLTVSVLADPLAYRDYGESMILLGKELFEKNGPDDIGSGPTYIRKSDAQVYLEERGII